MTTTTTSTPTDDDDDPPPPLRRPAPHNAPAPPTDDPHRLKIQSDSLSWCNQSWSNLLGSLALRSDLEPRPIYDYIYYTQKTRRGVTEKKVALFGTDWQRQTTARISEAATQTSKGSDFSVMCSRLLLTSLMKITQTKGRECLHTTYTCMHLSISRLLGIMALLPDHGDFASLRI